MQKFLRIFAIAALLGIVGYALTITGSPAHTRMVNEDMDTLEGLEQLHRALTAYHQQNGHVLTSLNGKALNAINSGSYGSQSCGGYYNNIYFSDEQLKRYQYTPTSAGYKICTNFNTNWSEVKLNRYTHDNLYNWAENFQKGQNCFERTIPECKKRN